MEVPEALREFEVDRPARPWLDFDPHQRLAFFVATLVEPADQVADASQFVGVDRRSELGHLDVMAVGVLAEDFYRSIVDVAVVLGTQESRPAIAAHCWINSNHV